MKNYAGRVFADRYALTRQIAVGAMGEVWAARDRITHREIAIKVLRPELTGQATFLQRLRVEARNAMQITHPNLATVLDHGEADGVGWIVMELVDGRPFNQYLADGRCLEAEELLPILLQVAYALQAVNAHRVVHRDIKPSNILLTDDGIVKLTDFGISTTPDQDTLTDAGMVMGTAQYLPPEQARGQEATHAGDLYALGVIAYEATVGKRPFTGETQVDVVFAHVNEPVPLLPEDVPAPLANIIYRLLRKDPKQRPADALELVREITAAAQALEISTAPRPLSLPQAQPEQLPTPTAGEEIISEDGVHDCAPAAGRAEDGVRDCVPAADSPVPEPLPAELPSAQVDADRAAVDPAPASAPAPAVPAESAATPPAPATPQTPAAQPAPTPAAPADPKPSAPRPATPRKPAFIQPASGPAWRHGKTTIDTDFWTGLLLIFLVVFTVSAIIILTFMRPTNATTTSSHIFESTTASATYQVVTNLGPQTPALADPTGRLMHTTDTEVPHHG